MTTFTAFTSVPSQAAAEKLGETLEALNPEPLGIGVFEIEDGSGLWEVGAYFTAPPDHAGLALLATLHEAKDFVVSELPKTDWVAKVRRDLAPVEAGRFFLYGSHDADKLPPERIGLLIDAAMAFGTGHHGTTLGCLLALDRLGRSGFVPKRIADVGCGTAVLAMAAAKLWKQSVLASDIDPVAVDVAEANIKANGLTELVQTAEAAGFPPSDEARDNSFDLVFANILKGPLIALAPDMSQNIGQGGRLILSGLLREQQAEVLECYEKNGFVLEAEDPIGDWSTLTLTRS
ncbi:50S ribosomal protein L11 methyltransferase [Aestuariibius insulae]|uniref:50S ribosomal protein L11 methyltransferase n=1 Tax=Aestuariibius insulae TaxID=2058287 RepID=UPI00345EE1E5